MSVVQAAPAAAPEPTEEPPKKKKRRIWLWLFLFLLLAGGGGAGAWYYFKIMPEQAELAGEAEEPPPPTIYFELRPAFVANLPGGRYLQVELDLMAHDQAVIEAVQKHNPAIRNDILLLLGNQKPNEIATLEGKLSVQKAAAEAINAILERREKDLRIEEVYFSSFVMQ